MRTGPGFRARLQQAIGDRALRWPDFVEGMSPTQIGGDISYRNFRGEACVTPVSAALVHVFMHGTHHRGQISAAISRLGLPVPEMDYIFYVRAQQRDAIAR